MTRKAGPIQARTAALAIVRRLREAGHVAYFAGGCVRDELLGLSPTDYDIATDAHPEKIRTLFKRTAEVGAAFGVVLVTPQEDEGVAERATVEVATFRSDGPYSDKRRPDVVQFGGPEQDAKRRDFTVNALFLDPLGTSNQPSDGATQGHAGREAPPQGEVIDLVGGVQDLKLKVIRAVGDPEARLGEDHLRALRAVRFAARLGFTIDPATAAAIRAHARDLMGISRERIGDEMRRMLAHASRAEALELLQDLGLDAPVLQEPTRALHLATVSGLHGLPAIPFATGLAAWALDRGLTVTGPGAGAFAMKLVSRWRATLCLSNAEREQLMGVFDGLIALEGEWDRAPVARQKRLAGAADGGFAEAVRLLALRQPQRADQIRARVAELAGTPGGLAPEPLINGDDLVAAGFKPGRRFKVLLERVYDAQLEGRVAKKDEAMALAAELWRDSGV